MEGKGICRREVGDWSKKGNWKLIGGIKFGRAGRIVFGFFFLSECGYDGSASQQPGKKTTVKISNSQQKNITSLQGTKQDQRQSLSNSLALFLLRKTICTSQLTEPWTKWTQTTRNEYKQQYHGNVAPNKTTILYL
uniref:Uncharacterized protein n=1 Tax=Entomoneis paludosa TaxID=265537 RepID=A0A7S2YKX5_9STRA|mmetsp:Transcript_37493/g.77786  ORF Transcript_37493/g.77786 Transcript_37493/m.77786 type:complete len:136 (+) Transcript_37493:111-518(+)